MTGIECKFVEKPPKAFQYECPICLLVLREPYQAACCGKSFCKKCIDRVKDNNHDCPTCNERNFNLFYNKGLEQSLYDFEVYCSHKSKGCEWRGELRELDKHLNSEPAADKSFEGCPFTVINCPLSHTGCDVKLPRINIMIHLNDELLSHVLKQTALMTALNTQLQNVKQEKQQLEQHMAILEEKIKKLEASQEVASHTGQPIGPVEFTMTNFNQYQGDEQWYSPPFYTHYHGYKMCLCVTLKRFGSGRGTHLGVSFYIICGEFDDQLKWPFRGDITYQLMNQVDDKNHVVKTVHFNENTSDEVADRVTQRRMSSVGRGHSRVFPLSNLEPKYLKNNCIKLSITNVVLT